MEKREEVLQTIKDLVIKNNIQKEDLLAVFNYGPNVEKSVDHKKLGIADILYYIGGAVVFFGIVIFVTQNWSALNTLTRVLCTLGSAIAAYFVGVFFSLDKKTENVGLSFHFISALVMPIGLYVVFYESGYNISTNGIQSLISALLFVVYFLSIAAFRKDFFIFFSIIFGTWLFFSFTGLMVGDRPLWGLDFFYYRSLLVGLTYVLLGYYFATTERASMSGFLYGFGILGFLGAAMALGGWKPNQNLLWEVIFPGLIFVVLFLSVYLKSKSFLTFGTIYLMLYITKITAEYFSGSMGWPLSLVIIGLFLIVCGYMFIYLKNKYLPKIG